MKQEERAYRKSTQRPSPASSAGRRASSQPRNSRISSRPKPSWPYSQTRASRSSYARHRSSSQRDSRAVSASFRRRLAIMGLVIIAFVGLFILRQCSMGASPLSADRKGSGAQSQGSSGLQVLPFSKLADERYQTAYQIIDTASFDYEHASSLGETADKRGLLEIMRAAQAGSVPPSVMDTLSLNPEIYQFAHGYLGSDPQVAAPEQLKDEILNQEGFPLILQFDKRWGYQPYGAYPLAISGCGPTCVSMLSVGLTKDRSITPLKVAHKSFERGFYTDQGTSWSLFTEGVQDFGIRGKQIPYLSRKKLLLELSKGHPVVASMKPGDFTVLGHFIIIVGVTDSGELIINDPNSLKRSQQRWPIERVLNQVKASWSFEKIT